MRVSRTTSRRAADGLAAARSGLPRSRIVLVGALLLTGPAAGIAGCAATGGTTRLRVEDFEHVTAAMAADLSAATFLARRHPGSEPWTISIDKAVNLSSDLIPESERWYLVQKVRSGLPMLDLARERNLAFVIPAEIWRRVMDGAAGETPEDPARIPTHQMRAEFRSVTRSAGLDRTDTYLVFYAVTDLTTGLEVWTGEYVFKRAARGRAWD